MDRFPSDIVLKDAQTASLARQGAMKLMICFGGNGRSTHFASVTASVKKRANFVENVAKLVAEKHLDGVDINWEYPGFQFGRGYIEENVEREWEGLRLLMRVRNKKKKKNGKKSDQNWRICEELCARNSSRLRTIQTESKRRFWRN